jgi:hypothetical protein
MRSFSFSKALTTFFVLFVLDAAEISMKRDGNKALTLSLET